MHGLAGMAYESFFEDSDDITALSFPVLQHLAKVTSCKLDKHPRLEGKLVGIKGQYWMFEHGQVWNVRSHAGYRLSSGGGLNASQGRRGEWTSIQGRVTRGVGDVVKAVAFRDQALPVVLVVLVGAHDV